MRELPNNAPTHTIQGPTGGRDGFESYAVSAVWNLSFYIFACSHDIQVCKDGVLGLGDKPFPRPPLFDENVPMLMTALRTMQDAVLLVGAGLSRALGLPAGERLEDFHNADQPSTLYSLVTKLLCSVEPRAWTCPTPPHRSWELDGSVHRAAWSPILIKGADTWKSVEPQVGHAVVNIGGGLSMMTKGLLRSSLHRVGPPPD